MSFDNVDDIYALSPVQEGLLFHSLERADVYVDQLVARLDSDLDIAAFRATWEELIRRHPVLRTAFLWDGIDEPLQVVRSEVGLPWTVHEDARSWSDLLTEDRERGFTLDDAPLLRMTLLRTGEGWRWLWTFHHLILDGWSARLLLREAQAIYAARRRRAPHRLGIPFVYRDYIAWLTTRDAVEAETFWRETLTGFDRPTRLDAYTSPVRELTGSARTRHVVSAETSAVLTRFARDTRVTLATVLQGAWAWLLSRYAREDDVIFGITSSGRPAELDGVDRGVGLFITTTPLRVRLDPGTRLGDWLRALQRRQLGARKFETTPLTAIQRWSDLPVGEALFDHVLVIETFGTEGLPHDDGDLVYGDLDIHERSNYPFALLVLPGERIELLAVHDLERFDVAFTRRLLSHLEILLTNLPYDAEATLDSLSLLDDTTRRRLAKWNQTTTPLPTEVRIDDLVADTITIHPERLAAVCGDTKLTYAELGTRAERLAGHLRRHGVGVDVPVGLLVARSVDMVVGILGILKAGGAYVPLDVSYPTAHLRAVLADIGAEVVVSRKQDLETLDLALLDSTTIIDLEALDLSNLPGNSTDTETSRDEITGDELAYVIHTSGSTGKPKGVMVSHRNLVASTTARFSAYDGPVGRYLLLSSFAFDSSVAGIFWTLTTGGTLVLPAPGEEQDLQALERLIAEHRVTHTLGLPALWRLLLDEASTDALASLEVVIVAGEACPPEMIRRHHELLPDTRLYNEYGPTETTVWATMHELRVPENPVPIGKAIANARLHLVDMHGQLLPPGVAGELYIAGEGVARGYWQRPGATAERFVALPSSGEERVYRTGDLASLRDDGSFVFLGRADGQVKVRGHRIETTGVEALLEARPEIQAAAVAVRGSGRGAQLLAWVVPTAGITLTGLREQLLDSVPAFLVPESILTLDRLPRRPNGKIDYRALPPHHQKHDEAGSTTAPRDAIERTIAEVWQAVLGVDEIKVGDHFFALGGDSILGIQVVSRLRQAGLAATPRDIAAHPTLEALAVVLRDRQVATESDEGPFIGEIPLAPIQRWFFARDLPAPHHWNLSRLFEVSTELDAATIERALVACVSHHDLLRARFQHDGDDWRQVVEEAIAAEVGIPFDVVSAADQERAFADAQAGLDLAHGPVIRAVLAERRLLVIVHHLVIDVVSWNILTDDLETALGQLLAGEPIALPPRTTSYRRWVDSQHDVDHHDELTFWSKPVDPRSAAFPVDFEDRDPTEGQTTVHEQTFGSSLASHVIQATADTFHVRIDELLIIALALTVARWRDEPTLRLGLEHHGRNHPEFDLSRTVGWLTSAYPVTLRLSTLDDLDTAIREIKDQLRAVPDDGVGWGLLRYAKDTRAELATLPEPQLLFNYLGRTRPTTTRLQPIPGGHESARDPRNPRSHLLEINARIDDDRLVLDWLYCVHRRETIATLATHFADALARIVDHGRSTGSETLTTSDFPDAELDDDDLSSLLDRLE